MAPSESWLARWRQLAANGNPDAQIVMAWEFVRGEVVPKDFDQAVKLFRAAEVSKGSFAKVHLAKAKIMNKDESYKDVIREDCNAGFGPARDYCDCRAWRVS